MITLKHFLSRPTWAAAAGYKFNYIDCMAFSASLYDVFFSWVLDFIYELPGTEVRELPFKLIFFIFSIIGIFIYPFIFWIVAFSVWVRCKNHRSKYHIGTGMNATARQNLAVWLSECDHKWSNRND